MIDADDTGGLPRAGTTAVADALLAVDAILADAPCAGHPVRYTLQGDATALTRQEVEAWLVGAEAEGIARIRYHVTCDGAGEVQVAMAPVESVGSP